MEFHGSSPLTRGKPGHHGLLRRQPGLIPAHAGKTPCRVQRAWSSRAHPRSRGENTTLPQYVLTGGGSSPLTRGKLSGRRMGVKVTGLIPAHAGKTSSRGRQRPVGAAHPRSRGENLRYRPSCGTRNGSSPLTRGKRDGVRRNRVDGGLIPAHAGKTTRPTSSRTRCPAHPRSRGENTQEQTPAPDHAGSSPLTRGKHFLTCAFTAQIDQILETLELAVSFGSYSVWVACATDAPQDQVRSIGLVLPSSRGAS